MSHRTPDQATTELADAVSLWRLHGGEAAAVVDAAVACLLADRTADAVRVFLAARA